MAEPLDLLAPAYRTARLIGWTICGAWPLILAGLVLAGVIPPGNHPVEGVYQQVGYTFTGLVFLSAAWVAWRKEKVLRGFRRVAPAIRLRLLQREILLYAALFEFSCLWGVLYWMLIGRGALRYVLAFMALTPIMFYILVPRLPAWIQAQEEVS